MVAEPGSRRNRAPAAQKFKLLILCLLTLVMTTTTAPSLIDTKLLGIPKGYSGNRSEWNQWKFVFRAYVGAVNGRMKILMDQAQASDSIATSA